MKNVYFFAAFFRPERLLVSGAYYYADRVVYEKSTNQLIFYIGEQKTGLVDCMYLDVLRQYFNGSGYDVPWKLLVSVSDRELTDLTPHFVVEEVNLYES